MQQAIEGFLEKLKADGRSSNTLSAYRTDLHELYRFLQGISPPVVCWQEVTVAHRTGYLAHLQRLGRSPATIARKSIVLGRFFNFLGQDFSGPATAVTPRQDDLPSPVLDSADVEAILTHAAHSAAPTARRDRVLLELLWETGALPSELVNLNVGDWDPASRTIFLDKGGSRERSVILSPATAFSIADYLAQPVPGPASCLPADPLLGNRRSGHLTRQGVWLIVRALAQAAGIRSSVTPRHLRRAAALRLLEAGADRSSVQARLGVANLADAATDDEIPRLLLDGIAPTIHNPHSLDND